ncbi:MAG: hypothetical protein ABI876_01915 [Bacteroidota bacterium]
MNENMPQAELRQSGRYPAQTLLGSQLIEHGMKTVEDLFRHNPFGLAERKAYTIFEVDPSSNERKFFGKGSVLPKPVMVSPDESLSDDDELLEPTHVIPLFEPEDRRENPIMRADRQTIASLRDELSSRDNAVDRSHRIAEQALMQNDRMLDQIQDTLSTVKELARDRDETSKKLAGMEAQVDAILKLREFEETVRKERESEREAWRQKEREWEQTSKDKGQGLGDMMESMVPFAPIIQMLLERMLPPANPGGAMPPQFGGMPGGMPPGMMPPHGMPGGMPPQGMPPQGMPPQGMPFNGMPPMQGVPPPHTNGSPMPQSPTNGQIRKPPQNGVASNDNLMSAN